MVCTHLRGREVGFGDFACVRCMLRGVENMPFLAYIQYGWALINCVLLIRCSHISRGPYWPDEIQRPGVLPAQHLLLLWHWQFHVQVSTPATKQVWATDAEEIMLTRTVFQLISMLFQVGWFSKLSTDGLARFNCETGFSKVFLTWNEKWLRS